MAQHARTVALFEQAEGELAEELVLMRAQSCDRHRPEICKVWTKTSCLSPIAKLRVRIDQLGAHRVILPIGNMDAVIH